MSDVKFKKDIPQMARLKVAGINVLQDPESGRFYYDICVECGMLLDEDSIGFGHDCEG